MKFTKRKAAAGVIFAAVLCALTWSGHPVAAQTVKDGVMGSGMQDETVYNGIQRSNPFLMPTLYGADTQASYTDDFINASFVTQGNYTTASYYHKAALKDKTMFQGIDVSWWQSKGDKKTTGLDWQKIHAAGIDFAFVRAASRDSAAGTIYEDTCADSHIQGALKNDIDVGLYVFSQALTEKEAVEEAQYLLDLIDLYDWEVDMPIVIDREKGSYNRLTEGKLSKAKETAVCQAFADTIHAAGYDAYVYAAYSWIKSYIDTGALKNCGIWIARYNNTTTSNSKSGVPYADVSYDYDFWQYSSVAKVDGYSGNLDANFWYKDTKAKTTGLAASAQTTDSIRLSWKGAGDAPKYRVYRFDENQNKYVYLGATTKKNYTDTGLEAGKTYQYRVRGYWTIGGANYYGTYSDVLEATTLPAKLIGVSANTRSSTSIELSWKKVTGADGYCIYRYDTDKKAYERIALVKGNSQFTYVDSGLSTGTEYQYKLRAYRKVNGTSYFGACCSVLKAVTKPAKVQNLKLSSKMPSVTLKWNPVEGADGYQVYRLNTKSGKYEKVITVKGKTTVTYTNSKLKKGSVYTFKVRAYRTYNGTNYFGKCSEIAKITMK